MTWLCLTETPQPPEILAASRGVAVRTINKHLRRLEAFHLAENSGEGWIRVEATADQMDALAAELGSLGRAEKQHLIHEAERQHFEDTYTGHAKGTGWERYLALRNRRRR